MKKLVFLFSLLSFVFIIGCQNNLLPSPKMEGTNDSESEKSDIVIWSAPENLVATHGLKNKVELSWQGVKSAVRYYIYEAPTPYDKFTQIAETTSNTTNYVLDEKSGSSKYYKVTAVKKSGEESPFSIVAHGTTLANPVITYIGQDEENSDSASSVHWYMNNCNASTYQHNVRYTINCFDPAGNNVAEKIHDGNSDYPSINFENLTPNTNYTYQVTAYIVSHQNDTEISDKVDSSTARRLRPNPPENLSATLGTSTSEITLTFDLPAMVDVALGNGIYEPKPLYFKIFRRVASEEAKEEDWKIIENKFATQDFASQYEPGQTVSYIDYADLSEIKRGIMYEYKIQSYADETTREISSNLSYATTQGFLMAVPKFEVVQKEVPSIDDKGTPEKSDDVYTEVKTNFNFTWNMHGFEKDYAYILSEKRFKLEIDNGEVKDEIGNPESYKYFSNIESLNEYQRVFDLTDESTLSETRGYYTYKIYIIEKTEDNFTIPDGETFDFVVEISAFGTTLVTQDTSSPEIKNFTTQDGYKDRVILSWTYDETIAKYTISYELEDGTINKIEDFSAIIEGKQNGDTLTYEHFVESGFSATYTLTALRGISVETEPVTLSTLGTPELTFDAENPQYDTISVKWNPVNKAETYEVSYSVDGTSYTQPVTIPAPTQDSVNPENFKVNPDGSYTYDFVKPQTYDDATKAGKDILVKIEAKNTLDSTKDNITTRLLGPVNIKATSVVTKHNNKIEVTWNPVNGAKKYLVKRDRYSVDNKTIESTDFYYVNPDGTGISVLNEDNVSKEQVEITLKVENNKTQFVLTDKAYENTEETKWKKNQDKINWGFPYHYTILPLANENDTFDTDTGALAEKVTYTNLSNIKTIGSALGYGHNVTATKSEDPRTVTITWTKPYLPEGATYAPILCRSEAGENNWEQTEIDIAPNATEAIFEPVGDERIQPYEFAIVYYKTSKKEFHLNQSYLDDLASKIDEYKEPINKGYAFAIETEARNVLVGQSATYNEKILWTPWDYEKRARGPKTDADYTVSMKNNNLGTDWKKVATYKNDGTVKINDQPEYETEITKQGNGIVITPKGLASNDNAVHNGLLKVLRDYKHYVKVIVTRVNSEGQEITASFADDEENYFMVRQITPGEFARSVALVFSYGIWDFHDGGHPGTNAISDATINSSNGGSFHYWWSWNFSGDYTYNISNYSPEMQTPANVPKKLVAISTEAESVKLRVSGAAGSSHIGIIQSVKLNVTGPSDAAFLGNGDVTLYCENAKGSMSGTYNNKPFNISFNSEDARKYWVPLRFGPDSKESWYITNSSYGWW